MSATNIVVARFGTTKNTQTRNLWQYDYGQILQFVGLDLPAAYIVHFSNSQFSGESKTMIGNEDGVDIPDEYLETGATVYAWIYLHTGEDDGETVYMVTIPVKSRPRPTEDEPTPVQQGVIDAAIAALNSGVAEVEQIANDIPQTIDDALQEAKDSGEFDGYTPIKGVDYFDGYTPIKGVDYFDGEPGHTPVKGVDYFDGEDGDDGATFTPSVSQEGIISWTNDAGLPNPPSVNIKGPQGDPGSGAEIYICSSSEYDPETRVPTVQNPETNTFYLVPAESATSPDMFVEWIFVNNGWEKFGSATVDVPVQSVNGKTGAVVLTASDVGAGTYSKPLGGIPANDLAPGVIPTVPVQDVQVDGTSVLSNGVANVPMASASNLGTVKVNSAGNNDFGIAINDSGVVCSSKATNAQTKAGTNNYKAIVPSIQHQSTFYGLAKAAGDSTQAASSNPVGTYTDDAKTAIRQMLDVPSTDDIPEVPVQSVNGQTGAVVLDAQDVGAYEKLVTGIPKTDLASDVQTSLGKADTALQSAPVTSVNSKTGAVVLTPSDIGAGTYSKPFGGIPASDLAAGVIPTVPVQDVQVNGTSVLSNGTANVPLASYNNVGVVKANMDYGIVINTSTGDLLTRTAGASTIKAGTDIYRPIASAYQGNSVFYGLAKVAGADMASVTGETVGVYPEAQKSAISQMLNGSVAVSGTTPTIAALPGVRYVCGEVATLSFTPSATGICDVVFTSGSTATVLTVPSTVKWPAWFNPTNLESNVTYELNVLDGVYGTVGVWS